MAMHRVRLLVMNAALGPLDYRVPEGMVVGPGSVVVAPLGPRQVLGIVWEADKLPGTEVADERLRPLLGVVEVPPLRAELRRLLLRLPSSAPSPSSLPRSRTTTRPPWSSTRPSR